MQAVYAYLQAKSAAIEVANEKIHAAFQKEPLSELPWNKEEATADIQATQKLLADAVSNFLPTINPLPDSSPKQINVANQNLKYLKNQAELDFRSCRDHMIQEAEEIYNSYLMVLRVLVETIGAIEIREADKANKHIKQDAAPAHELKLLKAPIYLALRDDEALNQLWLRRKIVLWDDKLARRLLEELVINDDTYKTYAQLKEATFEEDRAIIRYLGSKVLFNAPEVSDRLESNDLHWADNREVVKNMLVKTIKRFKELSPEEIETQQSQAQEEHTQETVKPVVHKTKLELSTLSMDWEDDKDFSLKLYQLTIDNIRELEAELAQQADNWDPSRFSLTDKIVLMLATTEFLHFPSIPVNVTINEYIEVAHQYGTVQSYQFVNGILDALYNRLKASGKIKKSGRGLIQS